MADKQDHQAIDRAFREAVNMTASALEKFLESDESRSVGQKTDGGEATGHREGRRIVEILRKKKGDLRACLSASAGRPYLSPLANRSSAWPGGKESRCGPHSIGRAMRRV